MKKTLAFVLALVMMAASSVVAFAIDGIVIYNGNYAEGPGANNGELNPVKHELIQNGAAGDISKGDDTLFVVPGVKGDAVPTIDAVCNETEGYEDIPGFEDYLYILANSQYYDEAAFEAWYNEVKDMDLVMKYCWDGKYIYMYIEYAVNNYLCNASATSNLWQWNCIQFGIADKDALGRTEYAETLFGVKSGKTDTPMCGSVAGGYSPIVSLGDYMGVLKKGATPTQKKVIHEFRIDICKSLGREEAVKPLQMVKASVVVMCNNTGVGYAQRGVLFGHGITGRDSDKFPQHFINFTLGEGVDPTVSGGKPAYYTPTEEEKNALYRPNTSFFFYDIKDSDDFVSDYGTHTVATEENKFGVFSTEEDGARFSSAIYPNGLWATGDSVASAYAVITYRTSSEGMNIGLNFTDATMVPDLENGESEVQFVNGAAAYPTEESKIVADGTWRKAVIRLADCEYFRSIVTKFGIEITKGSVDIESIMFFGWNPSEVYGFVSAEVGCSCTTCDENCPCAGACDADVCSCDCFSNDHEHNYVNGKCECGETDPNYKSDNTNVQKPAKKKGCKSSITAGAALVAVAAIASGAVLLKKKED